MITRQYSFNITQGPSRDDAVSGFHFANKMVGGLRFKRTGDYEDRVEVANTSVSYSIQWRVGKVEVSGDTQNQVDRASIIFTDISGISLMEEAA
ncbi:MAG: hypothetical protein KC506_03375 [Nanoarchaeota archaeon]|nr:hypothetical protein [Nanoarchaeota archaeon]